MHTIRPFLWFDNQAEEAVNFYASIFPDAKVGTITRVPEGGPAPAGTVLMAEVEMLGQRFLAMNGGPRVQFNDAVSFLIECETQEEVDTYWDRLLQDGGAPQACGWLTDKYGLRWQVTPKRLLSMYTDGTPEQASRVMAAMMDMIKLDLPTLQRAYDGA